MPATVNKTFDIDRQKAAKMLNVSTRTLDRYIDKQLLSKRYENGRVLLNREEIKDLSKRKHRSVRTGTVKRKKAVSVEQSIPVEVKTTQKKEEPTAEMNVITKAEEKVYKELYEEMKVEAKSFQQRLEGANYRVGQLEAQLKASVPLLEHKNILVEKKIELEESKKEIKKEQYNKKILYILLAALIALQPIWIILKFV